MFLVKVRATIRKPSSSSKLSLLAYKVHFPETVKALKKIGQGIGPRYRPNARPQRFSQICVDRAQSRERETESPVRKVVLGLTVWPWPLGSILQA